MYTPQNNLGPTIVFPFHGLTLKLIFTFLELIFGQIRYLQHLFDKLSMLAISVAIKMSIRQEEFEKKWQFLKSKFLPQNEILKCSLLKTIICDKQSLAPMRSFGIKD